MIIEIVNVKAKRLMKRLKETQIYAVNPLADQLQLFYQCLHGNDLFINKYWLQEQRQQV